MKIVMENYFGFSRAKKENRWKCDDNTMFISLFKKNNLFYERLL